MSQRSNKKSTQKPKKTASRSAKKLETPEELTVETLRTRAVRTGVRSGVSGNLGC